MGERTYNAIAAAVVGGTSSVLVGGKFANGTITAAYSRLLNDTMSGMVTGPRGHPQTHEGAIDELIYGPTANTGKGTISLDPVGAKMKPLANVATDVGFSIFGGLVGSAYTVGAVLDQSGNSRFVANLCVQVGLGAFTGGGKLFILAIPHPFYLLVILFIEGHFIMPPLELWLGKHCIFLIVQFLQ